MKKLSKKLSLFIIIAIILAVVSPITTTFAEGKSMSITIRVEGIESNVLYKTVKIPYSDTLILQEALIYIDEQEASISITGVDTGYITDINGESSGKYGGWDGWLFKVNGEETAVGIDALELNEGDNILLYYGDPYGVGMQFPTVDTTNIKDGILRFTSTDTTYDANNNATTAVNPVAGATVIWNYGSNDTKYVTDDKGEIKIEKEQLTIGKHAIQISKLGEKNIPLVLRLAPDTIVTIDTASITETTVSPALNTAKADGNEVAKKDERPITIFIILILAVAALVGFMVFKRKKNQ